MALTASSWWPLGRGKSSDVEGKLSALLAGRGTLVSRASELAAGRTRREAELRATEDGTCGWDSQALRTPKSEQRNSNVEERMVECAKEPTCQCPEQNFSDTHKKEADLLEVNQMQISVCVSVNSEREGTDQSSTKTLAMAGNVPQAPSHLELVHGW